MNVESIRQSVSTSLDELDKFHEYIIDKYLDSKIGENYMMKFSEAYHRIQEVERELDIRCASENPSEL